MWRNHERYIQYTIFPRSSDPYYIVTYYIKWVTTSWTHSIYIYICIYWDRRIVRACQYFPYQNKTIRLEHILGNFIRCISVDRVGDNGMLWFCPPPAFYSFFTLSLFNLIILSTCFFIYPDLNTNVFYFHVFTYN